MAGTKAGGKKTAATNKRLHGEDFYKKIGAKGGRNGHTGGFAANPALARVAGAKGGKKSRRTGVKNGQGKGKARKKVTKKVTPKTTPKVKLILKNHDLGAECKTKRNVEILSNNEVIMPEGEKRSLIKRIFRRKNA